MFVGVHRVLADSLITEPMNQKLIEVAVRQKVKERASD